jgi:hypothetical protein
MERHGRSGVKKRVSLCDMSQYGEMSCICTHAFTRTHTHTHTHIYIYIYTYIYLYTHPASLEAKIRVLQSELKRARAGNEMKDAVPAFKTSDEPAAKYEIPSKRGFYAPSTTSASALDEGDANDANLKAKLTGLQQGNGREMG